MLRLSALGGLSLDGIEGPLGTAGTKRRRLALLALLAAAGERGVSRDKLLAYLWPDVEADRARQALADMLASMRKDLGVDALFHGTADVRLDAAELTSDLAEFERALDRRDLPAAVGIYGGPFLDGFTLTDAPEFQRWTERERLRLEQRFRGALESLASEAKTMGEHAAAARWWRRLADIDPLSTHVAIEVMSALAAGGDTAAAVAHGDAHQRRMKEEFGAPPNQAVRAFAEKLKSATGYTPPSETRASAPVHRRSTGRVTAPSERDLSDDTEMPMSASRERGATIAGRYLIQREIGRGGMATVFLARDLKHDRDVALKFIHAELADAFGTERFQSEIAVLAKLQHPHILALYDSGEVEGALYYVMPFIGGESVRERLQREGQLPVAEALRLAREVAGALAYAHEQGVIHRDVKPENILLTNGHALVADFGIARAVSRAAGRRNTEDGFAVGTPAYMSPEQASGDPIDGRSDEYALACVLYEMLGGVPPFVGASGRSVLAQRFTEAPAPIRKLRDKVPAEVEAALQKALTRVPADRFATVGEFASALDVMDTMGQRRDAAPGWLAAVGRWKWAIMALAVVALGIIIIALRPAPLVADRYVVLPFRHREGASPRLLNGDACQQLLDDALLQWRGLNLVDGMRTNDAKMRHADGPLQTDDALNTARSLRAGRLIWGEVSQVGSDITVVGMLYEVSPRRDSVLRVVTVHIDSSLSDAEQKFAELADSLIAPQSGSASVDATSRGTRNFAAIVAYTGAHEALSRWDLARAESLFRESAAADPGFANAHFWLAQVMSWGNNGQPTEWRETAGRAYALRAQLGARDSARAIALNALATMDYPAACERYRAMTARDTLDFVAWYGLGDCLRRDRLVIPDSKSPSGFAFRSSYQAAINAYDHALRIVPSIHLAFAGLGYERLAQLLLTQSTQIRRGFALTPDTVFFGGFATLRGDSVAIIPYRFIDISAGRADTGDAGGAIAANRARLLAIARSWKNAYPRSPSAYETLARALEGTGNISGSNDPSQSALAAIDSARALARDRADSIRTGVVYVRVLLEGGRYAEARAASDAVLALAADPSPREADDVKGLAALTGKTKRAVDLLRRSAPDFTTLTPDGRLITPPLPVSMSARALLGFVAMGGPADSIMRLQEQVGQLVQGSVSPAMRATVRNAVLVQPAQLAFPLRPAVMFTPAVTGAGELYETQTAFARGDSARAREMLRAIIASDAKASPGDLSLDIRFQYAWLAAATGDSGGAAALADRGLNGVASYGEYLLDNVQTPASLVRMMALRAELAARAGDTHTARQWASAAATLWATADPELDPVRDRLRALATP